MKFRVLPDQSIFPEKLRPDPVRVPLPDIPFLHDPEKLRPDPETSRLPENAPRDSPENDLVTPENPVGRFALMRRPYIEGSVALLT